MKPNDFVVCVDAGHGGLNKGIGPDKYVTYPSKCFQHNHGKFHSYGWFFEGVFKLKETQARAKAVTEAHNDLVDALLDVQCRLDSIQEGRTWIWVAPCSRKCKEAGFHH